MRSRTSISSSRITASTAILLTAGLLGCAGDAGTASPKLNAADVIDPSLRAGATAAEAAYDYPAAADKYRLLLSRNPEDRQIALKLARMLRYAGAPQEAIDFASAYLAERGPTAAMLAELGKAQLAADRLALAARSLAEAAELAPENWSIHSALGVVHDYQSDYDRAREAYGTALRLSPNNPAILNNLGLSRAQAGDIEGALSHLQVAAEQPSATAQVRQNLALVLAIKGDLPAAERLARADLPDDAVRNNMTFFRSLAGQPSR